MILDTLQTALRPVKPTRQIVFLHIPKTAGQSIVKELVRVCGSRALSPIRTHTQAAKDAQLPPSYALYAGHLDWVDLAALGTDRFSFSVLRNPKERIASFYFFLKREAERLSPAQLALGENTGKRMLLTNSADDFFFGGDASWQAFIHDHFDNFYTTYFATRRMRGFAALQNIPASDRISLAFKGTNAISQVYGMGQLDRLQNDLTGILGVPINLQKTRINTGPPARTGSRWSDLLALFERDESKDKLQSFVSLDWDLMQRLGLEDELTTAKTAG